MKKRVMALFLSMAMVITILSGCGNSNESSGSDSSLESNGEESSEDKNEAETGEKITLKFYIWSDEENYMTEVADNYNNSQEKVTVEVVSIPNDSYDDKLRVMLSGGSDADIVDIRSIDQVLQYETAGALLDITDYVQSSDLDVSKYGVTWDLTYPKGTMAALPTRTTCWMLFYNVDMLESAGVTMPDQPTWEEYREMTKQLTNVAEGEYGGCWLDWRIYQVLATQKKTYLNDDDITDVKEGLEFINALLNEDKSHTPLAEIKGNDSKYLADFENEKVAMMMNGEWLINMLMTDTKDGKTNVNWDVAPMPVQEGMDAGTTWGSFQFAGIPNYSKHPEESFAFLQYLCGEGGAEVLPKYGMLPAYADETGEVVFREQVGKESVSEVVFNAKKIPEAPSYDKYNELVTSFSENAELYLFGEKDIDATMDNFNKQREEIMK